MDNESSEKWENKICPVCKKKFTVFLPSIYRFRFQNKAGKQVFCCKWTHYNLCVDKEKTIDCEELTRTALDNRTQRQLAKIMGVTQHSIWAWANGISKPSKKNIERLTKLNFT